MSRYSIDVFVHVIGVIAVFVGYGSLLLAVIAMRRASDSDQVRAITSTLLATRKIGLERVSAIDVIVIVGVLMIAITGLDMALTAQLVRAPWVDVATGSFLVLAPIGPLVTNPRLHRIEDAANLESSGPMSNVLRARTNDPLLASELGSSTGILIGVVFLMTTKPGLVVSLVAVLVAVAAGLALSWSFALRPDAATPR